MRDIGFVTSSVEHIKGKITYSSFQGVLCSHWMLHCHKVNRTHSMEHAPPQPRLLCTWDRPCNNELCSPRRICTNGNVEMGGGVINIIWRFYFTYEKAYGLYNKNNCINTFPHSEQEKFEY